MKTEFFLGHITPLYRRTNTVPRAKVRQNKTATLDGCPVAPHRAERNKPGAEKDAEKEPTRHAKDAKMPACTC